MMGKFKELIRGAEEVQPVHSEKWRNLTFDKDGKSYLGVRTYPTERAALDRHIEAYDEFLRGEVAHLNTLGGVISWEDVSYAIQIPVKA